LDLTHPQEEAGVVVTPPRAVVQVAQVVALAYQARQQDLVQADKEVTEAFALVVITALAAVGPVKVETMRLAAVRG
jgi:hypothetical protein